MSSITVKEQVPTSHKTNTHTASFMPTALQLRYRAVRAAALAEGVRFSDSSLARQLGCRNATISNWKSDSEFVDWVDGDVRAAAAAYVAPVMLRTAQLALQGSMRHLRLLVRFLEATKGHRSQGVNPPIVVGVPRPRSTPSGTGEDVT